MYKESVQLKGRPIVAVELVTTGGVFALDGGEWEVTNNVWLVGDDSEVLIIDAAHDHGAIVEAVGRSACGGDHVHSWSQRPRECCCCIARSNGRAGPFCILRTGCSGTLCIPKRHRIAI